MSLLKSIGRPEDIQAAFRWPPLAISDGAENKSAATPIPATGCAQTTRTARSRQTTTLTFWRHNQVPHIQTGQAELAHTDERSHRISWQCFCVLLANKLKANKNVSPMLVHPFSPL